MEQREQRPSLKVKNKKEKIKKRQENIDRGASPAFLTT